jgi:hypothetical protein
MGLIDADALKKDLESVTLSNLIVTVLQSYVEDTADK